MKKSLLFVPALLVAAQQTCDAQSVQFFEGIQVSRKSNDGKILVSTDAVGNMTIQNVETNEVTLYEVEDDQQRYAVGFGNIFDDAGNMVGNTDDNTPAILQEGVWTPLPLKEADRESGKLNSADGITPDGLRICGGVARSSFSADAEDVMMAPVIWEQQADGSYGLYTELPYPAKDFTGRTPQYVTARSISADGKTVIGQIVDYSGSFPMPIVYREDAKGHWSYELVGEDICYDKNAVWPAYPEKEPQQPDATLYMDEASAAAYAEAYAKYQEELELYWEGKLDEYPTAPDVEEYLTDAEGYAAAQAAYEDEHSAFMQALQDFDNMFWDFSVIYGPSFDFNSVFMSNDGHYMTAMYAEEDPDADPLDGGGQLFRVLRFDLQQEGCPYEMCDTKDGLPTYVMDNGTVMYASPVNSETRTSYLWEVGKEESESLLTYLWKNAYDAYLKTIEELVFYKPKKSV